ncbi:MAG: hypothetical protein ACPGSD_17645 [Flavobacteriales bacterium]|jgi:hypothetical protein
MSRIAKVNSKVVWKGLNGIIKSINLGGKCCIMLSDGSLLNEIDVTELIIKG